MKREQLFDGFEFNDQTAVDEKIHPPFTDRAAAVAQLDNHLPSERNATMLKFDRHRRLVNRLQETRA